MEDVPGESEEFEFSQQQPTDEEGGDGFEADDDVMAEDEEVSHKGHC
jgi:hypothetical protein